MKKEGEVSTFSPSQEEQEDRQAEGSWLVREILCLCYVAPKSSHTYERNKKSLSEQENHNEEKKDEVIEQTQK